MSGITPHKARLLAENRIRWQLGFNDPTLAGWAVTASYAIAAVLALLAARRAPARSFERRFWWLALAALFALGVNKQLDLHILIIDFGRAWAVDNGWYPRRRVFQAVFVSALFAAGLLAAVAGALAVRQRDAEVRLALSGLLFTSAYVLVRATAFNHANSPLHTEIAGIRWDWLMEVAGIAMVAVAAWRYRRGPR